MAAVVHTYYQPICGSNRPQSLLNLWMDSWQKAGFKTVILSEEDARSHPGYSYFVDRISRFPTINNREYERACYMRHLAMANIGGGFLTDYDVICRDKVEPGDVDRMPNRMVLFEPTRVPCACFGNGKAFEDVCDILCEYRPNGESHVSDMTIIRKTKIQTESSCIEHLCSGRPIENDPGDGWKTAPMIHFSTYSFAKLGWRGDKADLIQRVLRTL